jgi:hypothetical protein
MSQKSVEKSQLISQAHQTESGRNVKVALRPIIPSWNLQ